MHPLERILRVLGPAIVVVHWIGATVAVGWVWGAHAYAFFPLWVALVATLCLAGLVWLVWRRHVPRLLAAFPDPARASKPARIGLTVLGMAAAGAVYWALRIRHTLLGDANAILLSLPSGDRFHPHQPLTVALESRLFELARGGASTPAALEAAAERSVALMSVAAGMLFVPVAFGLAGELGRRLPKEAAPRRATVAWLVGGLFLAQGYVQLFCGYVENYAPYTLALGLFLWLGLRFVDGRAPFLAPALVALLALGLHLSGAVLLPSLLFLWIAGLRRPERRRGVLRDTAMALVAGAFLVVALARLGGGYRLGESFLQVFRAAVVGGGADASYLWSLRHGRDFLNEQLLIGPLGFLLFAPALVVAWRTGAWRHPATGFLLVCGATYLGASWVAGDSNLGYARNWDLLAPGGLVQAAAGVGILVGVSGPVLRPAVLGLALGVSLFHTAPWIALNASTERGLRRMAALPLGEGRAPTAVGNWYLRHGDDRRAREWFESALGEYPRNVNALELLGLIHSRGGRMQEAAAAFERASALRPDKPDYRHNLAEALFQLGRYAEALPHDERLCRERPESFRAWERRYRSLAALGRTGEARRVVAEALAVFARKQQRSPLDYAANFELGLVLVAAERPAEALASFERALGAEPRSVPALYNVSLMLWQLGRGPEARPHLERLLALDPEPALRNQAQAWLRELGG